MPPTILGLDVGGANIKAATADKRAVSVPFALWKEPDRLSAVLADVAARFDEVEGFAVTMTGELCDCFETRREGVNRILDAVLQICRSWPVGVWSTDGKFLNVEEARRNPMAVASANWHALATFAGGYVPRGPAILVDVGSTTTDVVPILRGVPIPQGKTDFERIFNDELVYTGIRRTPVCVFTRFRGAAELFATTHDAYLILGKVPESPTDTDTADGRPATRHHAHARLSRMLGGDGDSVTAETTRLLAEGVMSQQKDAISEAATKVKDHLARSMGRHSSDGIRPRLVASGSGTFLARETSLQHDEFSDVVSLEDCLGPTLSVAAPAYALAKLATERGLS